ncbi:unnamed protein product [Durusdinium trenchii]|uniref:SET domain-containing protein n=1 Tax=Durusdinium trenchii TaxID=1381693 RepID=A0ABP0NKV3_9DINO
MFHRCARPPTGAHRGFHRQVMGEDQLTKRDRASPMLGLPDWDLMQEPLRRPGAKRRQRLRRDALQLYARLGGAATLPAATLRPAELDAALAAMPLNAFGLWERGEEDGHCLVPLASMMNHSCVPNCRYQVENGAISFYALRDIEVDEELTFSYIDDSSMSTAERKRFIRTSWDFECRCLRCTADGADAAPKGARMTTRTLWAVGTVRTVVDAAVEVNACQVSHIAAVLNSCAQMQWRDDHLLCGLTEALRCAAELRRGTVRDYAVCLQSLRRLNYCPWVGALRHAKKGLPVVQAYRKAPDPCTAVAFAEAPLADLVLTLRFAAEFSIQQVPQVRAEGLALCRERGS